MRRPFLVAVGVASGASLLLELALTRLLSVTTWYHFGFAVISGALLGLGAGATAVGLLPRRFPAGRESRLAAWAACLASVATVLTLVVALRLPFAISKQPRQLAQDAVYAAATLLPFAAMGVLLALALRAGARRVGLVYGADLLGAALGALLFVPAARHLGAPGTLFLAGALFALAALLATRERAPRVAALLALLLALGGGLLERTSGIGRIRWAKGPRPETAKETYWNAFSYVSVSEHQGDRPFGWGFGDRLPGDPAPRQLEVVIDMLAGTVMTAFPRDGTAAQGKPDPLAYLRYDVTAAAYAVLEAPSVYVIGVGGGRDILTAVTSGAREVTGVEINGRILDLVRTRYADLVNLADRPGVTLAVDEARSFLARKGGRWDLIQASLIDTWAASTSGAFALTENSLYTVEAWRLFLGSLSPAGILSVSRWTSEVPRVVSVALRSLELEQVPEPSRHLAILQGAMVGNVLVKRSPFTPEELDRLEQECALRGFTALFLPGRVVSPGYEPLAQGPAAWDRMVAARTDTDLSPPHDDRPFFFYQTRPREWLDLRSLLRVPRSTAEMRVAHVDPKHILLAILVLAGLAAVSLLVVPPLLLVRRDPLAAPRPAALVYMAALGLAFMLVEVPLLVRLAIVLGHPVLSLSVVLGGLLVASGLGSLGRSLLAPRIERAVLGALPFLVVLTALGLDAVGARIAGLEGPLRPLACLLLVAGLGVPMGMALPAGLSRAAGPEGRGAPLLFGVNGAFSVLGSVGAMILTLNAGTRVALLAASLLYGAAALGLGTLRPRQG